ncbi:winged helix-turn-helix domain-containing protein [Deinococcus frigens]|uniref:winged helix-turn-helix domain-containing protein n=1 Tax=Deinococcus frigens TaxID=249403 RepID=UPI000495CDB7|nr:winged helix-turn-helix domain-containing protein [Deinococcus frigens]
MTPTPADVQRLTDADTARALRQNVAFLTLFVAPHSPSEIAVSAGMAANLAHHHARKLAGLGLLLEVRREGGRVFYQLAAREFRVPWTVLPPVDPEGGEVLTLRRITDNFQRAYERSFLPLGSEDEEAVIGFSNAPGEAEVPPKLTSRPLESHPSHLEALTLRLTPERYRKLVGDLSQLLKAAAADGLKDQGQVCTLAVLASRGALDGQGEFVGRTSHTTSSFLGAD